MTVFAAGAPADVARSVVASLTAGSHVSLDAAGGSHVSVDAAGGSRISVDAGGGSVTRTATVPATVQCEKNAAILRVELGETLR